MARYDAASARNLLELIECLEEEYEALLAEDLARLEVVLARKKHVLTELAADSGLALGKPQGERTAPPAAWARAVTRARDLTRRNAIVLAPRAGFNAARLRFLQSALGTLALYGSDGRSASSRMAVGPGQRA
jgi:flagellar biosynthesis/type III secretory pathway chaperone